MQNDNLLTLPSHLSRGPNHTENDLHHGRTRA
jgi:hypothetical protein